MQPLVSFILFAFNQEQYVRAAVSGALAQTYEPLEIILSDDCSSDQTFAIMQEMAAAYTGPHRVILRRSPENSGFASHVNAAAHQATGRLVILAAGDDVSHPQRTGAIVARWLTAGGGTATLCSDFEAIDPDGLPTSSEAATRNLPDLLAAARGRGVLGATSAYTRDVFDDFPPIQSAVIHEDRVLPFRSLLLGGTVLFVDRRLVQYRVVGGVSRKSAISADHFLRDYTIEQQTRALPDATQRLADLKHIGGNRRAERACRRTVAHHRAMADLASSRSLRHEVSLMAGIARGAPAGPLLKHYLKLRMRMLFNLHYRRLRAPLSGPYDAADTPPR